MFSPSSVNVLCFDPHRGADQARSYAAKYCSKPEKWRAWRSGSGAIYITQTRAHSLRYSCPTYTSRFFLETERSGLQHWLKCRTVGLCMAYNRLMGFLVVRSTRPVTWIPSWFVPTAEHSSLRSPQHLASNPDYPDML